MTDRTPNDARWEAPGHSPDSAKIPAESAQPGAPGPGPGPGGSFSDRGQPVGAGQQWASPRITGLLPLRPLDFGTILGAPYRAMRRNPRVSLGVSLLVSGGSTLLTVAVVWLIGSMVFAGMDLSGVLAGDEFASDSDAGKFAGGFAAISAGLIIPALLSTFVSVIMQGLLSLEMARQLVDEKLRFSQLWERARARFGALLGYAALSMVAGGLYLTLVVSIILGSVAVGAASNNNFTLAIIVGVLLALGTPVLFAWVMTRLAFVPCVITIEHLTISAAFRRSWLLSRGAFWKLFGTLALVHVILNLASAIASTPIQLATGLAGGTFAPTGDTSALTPALVGGTLAWIITSTVIGAVSLVVLTGTTSLLYIDRRMRTEGLDLDLTQYVEGRRSGSSSSGVAVDPYLPRAVMTG